MSVFIAAACRTPVAPKDGALAAFEVHDLASPVIKSALAASGLHADDVSELVLSNALGAGGNPARVAALASELPQHVAGLSIDRQCAGGMDALLIARQMILSGAAEVVVAGGAESYSRRPLRARTFADGRPAEPYEQARFTPWADKDPEMTKAAADLAQALGISRRAQDDWAVASHQKAWGVRHPEILPLGGLHHDSFARHLRPEVCAKAPAINGTITAANAAVAADGAAFCVLVSERIARRLSQPMVELVDGITLGSDPTNPGLAPIAAIRSVLARTQTKVSDLTAVEIMEAYAVQAIACVTQTGLDPKITNLGGGALARGHPIGASGAINVARLTHELGRRGGLGLAAIASAGGIGSAVLLRARQ